MSGSRSRTRGVFAALALLVAVSGTASTALAEPTAAEKETARTLLLSGREKRKAGKDKEALADFEKAHAIMHVPTTALDLGKTQEALGMLVEARQTYLEASRAPKQSNEAFERARQDAKKLADAIAPRLASLTVSVPKDAKVKIDDGEISASSIGVPLKVNPGKHQIIATLGSDEKRSQVDLAEGESKSIELELAGTPVAPPPPPNTDKDKDKDKAGGETKLNTLVWVGGGVAAVGTVVGAITGIMAFSIKSDAEDKCDNNKKCTTQESWNTLDKGVLMGNISTGAFIVAGIGVGILVYGLLNPSKAEPTASTSSTSLFKPRILPTPFGLAGTF